MASMVAAPLHSANAAVATASTICPALQASLSTDNTWQHAKWWLLFTVHVP